MEKTLVDFDRIATSVVNDLFYRKDFKAFHIDQQKEIMELVRDKLLQLIIGKVDMRCTCSKCTRRNEIKQVLTLSAKGMSNIAIAKEMGISETSVRRFRMEGLDRRGL